jgi:PAS domain S-box-containing protein
LAFQSPKLLSLEDLRQSEDAAWLWDGKRGRLVWANAPGIKAFGGNSVFDLIDRPFDASEPALMVLANLVGSLQRGERKDCELHFPSLGEEAVFSCHATLHALADGRDGVLVVCPKPKPAPVETSFSAFDEMPVAAAYFDHGGAFAQINQAAAQIFDAKAHGNLARLVLNEGRAAQLLQRLQASPLVSSVEEIAGLTGKREARLTLRRLSDGNGPYGLLVLDDITERRQMERSLAAGLSSPPAPSVDDRAAFEAVGKAVNDAVNSVVPAPAMAKPQVPAIAKSAEPAPKSKVMLDVPPKVREIFDRKDEAFAIVQNGHAVFASMGLVSLLRHSSLEELSENHLFWDRLFEVKLPITRMEVAAASDAFMFIDVKPGKIPWRGGEALQYVCKVSKALIEPKPQQLELPKPEMAPQRVEAPAIAQIESNDGAGEELKSILDIASDGIITLDADGNILTFSAGAEAIFGYRIAEVLKKPLCGLMVPESAVDLANYLAGLEGPGLGNVFNHGREMIAVVKQGGTIPLFMTVGKLQSAKSLAAFCAVVRDLSPWKKREKELQEAKSRAESASYQKSEFLAHISHELRTPLNAILGFSDMMRSGQFGEIKNDRYRGYVNDIHTSGTHLLNLVNDLLDLSKVEAGKLELNFTAVAISDVIEHASNILHEQATKARVVVRKSLPTNLPRIVADLRAMRQITINLLSNAIKFTDPGGQVIISAEVSPQGELALRMKDTGIGMSAEQVRDALVPFKRVETTGRDRQGTGLGLPLTKALVEANRAKFGISSEPGQGTLAEIIFPTTRVLAE